MSPGAETILITVDIASNNQRLTDLRKELILNKQAADELNKGFKEGRVSIDTLAEGQQKASVTAKQITGEIALLTKANAQQTVANMAATGSTEQLRAQYGLSVLALNKLTTEERENTVAGQKLQATTKAMSDELKRQEAAYGSTGRSVGDYNKGVKDVNVVSGQLTSGLRAAADKGLSPFKAQLEQGTGLLGKFKGGSDLVSQGLGLLKGSGETGALGFKAIAGGIALTGIGLFVIAISAVVTFFAQSAEGGKILAGILGGLGAVLQVATDAVTGMGKALVEAFSSPKQAAKALVGFLEDQVINRFNAFGVILDALNRRDFKGVANGMLQLGTGVEDVVGKTARLGNTFSAAAQAGQALVLEQKALLKARQALAPEEAKEESRVAVLLRLSKERGKTAAEQLSALQRAGGIENELSNKKVALLRREQAAIDEGIRLKGAGRAADLKADLSAKKTEIEQALGSQKEIQAKIQVRESVFKEKQRTEARAAALQARQDEVINRQTLLDTALLGIAKNSAAELAVKKKLLEAARDLELAADKLTAAQKENIRAKALVAIKALEDEFLAKQVEAAKKAAEQDAKTVAARLTEAQREYTEAQQLLEDYLNTKRAAVEQDYAAGKIGESRYQRDLNAIDQAGNAAALVNARDYGKATGALLKKQADDEIKAATLAKNEKRKIKAAEQTIAETAVQAGIAASDAIISLLGEETVAGQAALAVKKTLALAEIGINLQKQLSLNAVAAAALNAVLPGSGIVYKIAADVISIAEAAAGSAKILGFASGGYVAGAGTGTSDSIPAMLSNGESVMNANTTATFAPLLSYLNQLGGGTGFTAPGNSAGRLNDGGLVARTAGASLLPTAAEIGAAVAANVPTSIGVHAINAAQGKAARVRQLTSLG